MGLQELGGTERLGGSENRARRWRSADEAAAGSTVRLPRAPLLELAPLRRRLATLTWTSQMGALPPQKRFLRCGPLVAQPPRVRYPALGRAARWPPPAPATVSSRARGGGRARPVRACGRSYRVGQASPGCRERGAGSCLAHLLLCLFVVIASDLQPGSVRLCSSLLGTAAPRRACVRHSST